jgi:hypothetical protein
VPQAVSRLAKQAKVVAMPRVIRSRILVFLMGFFGLQRAGVVAPGHWAYSRAILARFQSFQRIKGKSACLQ